jgi:hypothetical protein
LRAKREGVGRGVEPINLRFHSQPVCVHMICTLVLSRLLGANAFTFSESLLLEGWSGQSEGIWKLQIATRFRELEFRFTSKFSEFLSSQISKLARSLWTIPRIAPVSSCHFKRIQ